MDDQRHLEQPYAEQDKYQAKIDAYVTSCWENLEDIDIIGALYLADLSGLTTALRDPEVDAGYLRDAMVTLLDGHFRAEAAYEVE